MGPRLTPRSDDADDRLGPFAREQAARTSEETLLSPARPEPRLWTANSLTLSGGEHDSRNHQYNLAHGRLPLAVSALRNGHGAAGPGPGRPLAAGSVLGLPLLRAAFLDDLPCAAGGPGAARQGDCRGGPGGLKSWIFLTWLRKAFYTAPHPSEGSGVCQPGRLPDC